MFSLWPEEHTELGFQDLFQVFGFRTLFPFDALFPRQTQNDPLLLKQVHSKVAIREGM